MTRIGHGFDAHRLVEQRPLILGGVDVPFNKGLLGHSDADVVIHAIIDSLLGALALGDIGSHFPDSDWKYKGISSVKLLDMVAETIDKAQYSIGNIDVTIAAQAPKLAPFIIDMRQNIARALSTKPDNISIKATTTEGMGYTGRGEGISVWAVALLLKK